MVGEGGGHPIASAWQAKLGEKLSGKKLDQASQAILHQQIISNGPGPVDRLSLGEACCKLSDPLSCLETERVLVSSSVLQPLSVRKQHHKPHNIHLDR